MNKNDPYNIEDSKESNPTQNGKKVYGDDQKDYFEDDDFYYEKEGTVVEDDYYGSSQDRGQGYNGNKNRAAEQPREKRPYDDQYEKTPKKKPPKKKSHWMKGVVLVIVAVLLVALFFSPLYSYIKTFWGEGGIYPEKAEFTINRTITLSTDKEINYNIDLPVPQDIPGNDIQRIQDIRWGNKEELNTNQKYGQTWKNWSGSLAPGPEESFSVTYEVKTETIDWGYSSDESGTVDDISEDLKNTYNRNQWQIEEDYDNDDENDSMIEPNDPQIKNMAQSIVQGESNVYDKARAIYDWLNENIEYEVGGSGLPNQAVKTMEIEKGDCDEQSFLFASLSRAVGIPSWIELGVLYDRRATGSSLEDGEWGGHGWIQMQFVRPDGTGGWVNIDPVNDQFFARDATRFTEWVDDGGKGHLKDYYLFVNYTYSSAGPAPDPTIESDLTNEDMNTEGHTVLGGEERETPGFTYPVMMTAIIVSIGSYYLRKRRYSS